MILSHYRYRPVTVFGHRNKPLLNVSKRYTSVTMRHQALPTLPSVTNFTKRYHRYQRN
jgi:hypothetical protein